MPMASSTASNDQDQNRNKAVTGYPLLEAPEPVNPITNGYPQMSPPHPPQPAAVYLHHLFLNHQRNHRRLQQTFLCRLAAAALIFLLMMGFLFFILWLILRPRFPQVHLASATLSPLSTTNTTISAACNLTLLVTNTNHRISIFYDHFELSLVYQSHRVILSQTLVPPFMQAKKNHTFLETNFNMTDEDVGNDVVQGLKEDLSHGSIKFGVKILAWISFRDGGWNTKTNLMRVNCDSFTFGFSSSNGPGIFLNPDKQCEVAL